MSYFVKWKSRMSALLRSRRAIFYLCFAIAIVFMDNYEYEIRRGIGLDACATATLPAKMFQRLTTLGHPLQAHRVVLVSYSAHDIPAISEPCNKRALVAAVVNRLSQPDIDPAVIAIDHWFDPAACKNPGDQELSKELGDTLAQVSARIPIVLGEDSDSLAELSRDPDLPKLVANGFSRNDQILNGSAFSGPNWPNVSFGLVRINCDNRRIPLVWSVYLSRDNLEKPGRRWREPSLAYVTARLADPALNQTLQSMIYHEEHSTRHDSGPLTAFIPEQAFSPLNDGAKLKASALLCQSGVQGTARAMIDCTAVNAPTLHELRSMRGTVVVLGEDRPDDWHPSVLGNKVPGYVLQANYINSLLSDYYFRPLPLWAELALTLAGTVLLVILFELASSFWRGLIAATLALFAVAFTCSLIGLTFGWFLGFWPPLFLILITETIFYLNEQARRAAALRAQVVLIARTSVQVTDLTQLDAVLAKLPQGEKRYLREAQQIRDWAGDIARTQARINAADRAIFRQPYAQSLIAKIESFQSRIGGFDFALSKEFSAAAENWKQLALRQQQEIEAVTTKEPVHQVFRAGDPIDRSREAFVPRDAVVGVLAQQIMLSTGCPGIILYGRRRVGKSTVLRNLDGFLPPSVIPVTASMQNPDMFTSLADLVQHLVRQVDGRRRTGGEMRDLRGLYRFLGEHNEQLQAENRRVLLAIDEYEVIDRKIGEQVFPIELLDMLRESIQSHRQITWLLAGGHRITELPNANWTSYLVSARTVEVGPFTDPETRLLLTEPLKYSALWSDGSKRPGFAASFWGDGGIERIQAEAAGWPALVQLIAETAVDVVNNEGAQVVSGTAMDLALQQSIVKGDTVLSQLMRGESTLPGEWAYITAFRVREQQRPPDNNAVYESLRNRQIMMEENGYWRLRVPLMARWLRERG